MYSDYDDHELLGLRYLPCEYRRQHQLDEQRLADMDLYDRRHPRMAMLLSDWEDSPSLPRERRAYIEQYMLDYTAYLRQCDQQRDARVAWERQVVDEFKEADPEAYREIAVSAGTGFRGSRLTVEEEIREQVLAKIARMAFRRRRLQTVKPQKDEEEIEFFRCALEAARSLQQGMEPTVACQAEASAMEDYYTSRDREFFNYITLMLGSHKTFSERVRYGAFYNTLMHELCVAMSPEGTGHVTWRVPGADRDKLAFLIDGLADHLIPRMESPEQFEEKKDESEPPKKLPPFPRKFAPPPSPSPYYDPPTICRIL